MSSCLNATQNVASKQADITIFGADTRRWPMHRPGMLGSAELLSELERLKAEGRAKNADLARLLSIPTSRIAEIFSGKRKVTIDEMKLIVEEYDLESPPPPAISADTLAPLLDALLPTVAPNVREQSVQALAEALTYGLALLEDRPASRASSDALGVAARAAVSRFREIEKR